MGETKLTFKRYEKKYLLSAESYRRLMACMAEYIEPDDYHRSTVCSIYYDRDDFRLIRHSIDAPIYKEKLRVRCYNPTGEDITRTISLPLYYTGLSKKARISERGGKPYKVRLDREYNAEITVTIPANGYTWLVIK